MYGGVIVGRWLFVVMVMGVENVEDTTERGAWQRRLGMGLGVALLGIAGVGSFRGAEASPPPSGAAAEAFGDPASLGALLFTQYMLSFQITGVILLIAVVGVVVLNQRGRQSVPARPPAGD